MKLCVIIPCLNAAETIGTQLEALGNQSCSRPWEVIVSDNGSTDGTIAIVERYRRHLQNLRVVVASGRRGSSHARNIGAQAAIGDALAYCDADDEVAPGWLAAMFDALSKYDFVASRFDFGKLNQEVARKDYKHVQQDGVQKVWYPPYLPHAGCSGLGIRRSLHEAIGGFDETLRVLEDTDYCFRVQLAGWNLNFAPDAIVHIRLPTTMRRAFVQSHRWAKYNVLLYKRYRPPGVWISQLWKRYARGWKRLARRLPHLRQKGTRAEWVRLLGRQAGRLEGSLRYRVFPV